MQQMNCALVLPKDGDVQESYGKFPLFNVVVDRDGGSAAA
jgi:hypothetical protein